MWLQQSASTPMTQPWWPLHQESTIIVFLILVSHFLITKTSVLSALDSKEDFIATKTNNNPYYSPHQLALIIRLAMRLIQDMASRSDLSLPDPTLFTTESINAPTNYRQIPFLLKSPLSNTISFFRKRNWKITTVPHKLFTLL